MLDNDNLTYKKRLIGGATAKQGERALITLERSQKLDLLIHLLTNLRQALVVCGPEGIGKTTLLKTLQDQRKDQWQICLLSGSSALSFEAIINQLSRSLNLSHSNIGFDLASLRAYCEKQKVVLIVDDAGELVPGLIGELADFAASLSGLRLVFSMTYDEFHIKAASDKSLDDCHFIELPPLSQKQCAEYLQNLSAQPGAMLSFNAVTESLVADLYRQTNGIPGKLLAEIPKLNQYQNRQQQHRLGLWAGLALAIVATGWAVTALWPFPPAGETTTDKQPALAEPAPIAPLATLPTAVPSDATPSAPPTDSENRTPAPQPQAETVPTDSVSNAPPAIEPSPAPEQATAIKPAITPPSPESLPVAEQTGTQNGTPPVAATPAPPITAPAQPPAVTETPGAKANAPANAPTKTVADQKPQKTANGDSNFDWIMAQPANNYTLQVMTLSTKDAAKRFMKKYADYGDSLTYYTVESNGQEKFIVIYGSFQSATEARQYKEIMPGEFKQALEKRFRAIQKESRR